MTLYQTLLKAQAHTDFKKSSEWKFYKKHVSDLSEHILFARLTRKTDPFSVIRANIALRSIINKERIDNWMLAAMKNGKISEDKKTFEKSVTKLLSSMRHFSWNGESIYVPLFPMASIYGKQLKTKFGLENEELLSDYDGEMIDPFDYYGYALYESKFTNMITVKKTEYAIAMYDSDSECLYIINDQGRLENTIAFFDKNMAEPNKGHIVQRAKAVAEAYFANDRKAMVEALFNKNLISEKMYKTLMEKK